MNGKPDITIITSVYNVSTYLRQCIESIISQTFTSWELLLVDDGSTDGSGSICDEYALMDSRIRVLHKENTGPSDSRNIALTMAEGKLIGFVDSDDWIGPSMYQTLYDTLTANDADIAICGHWKEFPSGKKRPKRSIRECVLSGEDALKAILLDRKIQSYVWDKLFRRELLTARFPSGKKFEDYSTLHKWFANAGKVAVSDRREYHYRQRGRSIMHSDDAGKCMDFFDAEKERYTYVVNNIPDRSFREKYRLKVIRTAINQAKHIVRCKTCSPHVKRLYLKTIRNTIKYITKCSLMDMGIRQRYRLWMFMKHEDLFRQSMIASSHLKFPAQEMLFP